MRKKIYAVKKGKKPGIYMEWLDLYEQIQDYPNSQMRSFSYLEEFEYEDETNQESLAYALKLANEYLSDETDDFFGESDLLDIEEESLFIEDVDWENIDLFGINEIEDVDWENIALFGTNEIMDVEESPFLENEADFDYFMNDSDEIYEEEQTEHNELNQESQKEKPFESKTNNLQFQMHEALNEGNKTNINCKVPFYEEVSKEDCECLFCKENQEHQALFEILQIENAYNGNSPWLEVLLEEVGLDKPYVSNNSYTGRYACTSLYTGLLYFILQPDVIWSHFFMSRPQTNSKMGFVKNRFTESTEYQVLKQKFSSLEAVDLSEVRYRNADFAEQQAKNRLVLQSETYQNMKAFIKRGNHNLIDVYEELIQNNIYREELLMVSGPYQNPHIQKQQTYQDSSKSIQDLIAEATNIGVELKKTIFGQNEAINKLEKAFFHTEKEARLSKMKRGPRNVYLFAGPSGVGKTITAQLFANMLHIPYKRLDMAGYAGKDSIEEIAGISSFWKSSKPGVLTSFAKDNPKCVILLDEIEKAHSTVIRLFLRLLDEGVCFDRYYDTDISFENAILIFTTNAGKQLYIGNTNENLTMLSDNVILDALKKDINKETNEPYFPPEIVSRFASHTIIMFNHLKADTIRKVLQKDLTRQLKGTQELYGYDLQAGSDCLSTTIQLISGANADARTATKRASKIVDHELYEFFVLAEEKIGVDKSKSIEQIAWEVDFTDTTEEIKELYFGERNCVIAIFGDIEECKTNNPPLQMHEAFHREYEEILCPLSQNNVTIKATTDKTEFLKMIHEENVLFTLICYEYGLDKEISNLNIADAKTKGAVIFEELKKEREDIPVYILQEENGYFYTKREKQELINRGIISFVESTKLQEEIVTIYWNECCKKAMDKLSIHHQVLNFETRKEIDIENKKGKIVFYHLELKTAIEAEDKAILLSDELRPKKAWSDLYISEDIKAELQYFIDYLQNPKIYKQKGVRVPKGVLMCGAPGTGKTSLAKVVASESHINFLSVSADELLQGGAGYVHQQFCIARKYAPTVFFIDEIDAIGFNRGKNSINTALNALLTEMDGFQETDDKPVFIIGATNLGSAIDPALERRFDRTFSIDLPDKEGRKWMLHKLIQKHRDMFQISEEEVQNIAERSVGMSPAGLENVVETALREAIRRDKFVDDVMFDDVFERCHYGERKDVYSKEESRHTAYHEAGHAFIHMYYGKTPNYMSIISRSDFGGYVMTAEQEPHPTKEKLLQKICASLGGRAAELEFGYGLTPGAASDLRTATELATKMVCEFGMYEDEVGLAVILQENLHKNENAQRQINQILTEQLKLAKMIIREHKDTIVHLVNAVMGNEQKYLTQKELLEIYQKFVE